MVVDFVERTGIDVLAISFGNSHGVYKGPPQLNLDLVRDIALRVDIPLAMHGASGLSEQSYAPILDSGISKINYYTAMARIVSQEVRDWLAAASDDQLVYHHLLTATIDGFDAATRRLLGILRAAYKADHEPAAGPAQR